MQGNFHRGFWKCLSNCCRRCIGKCALDPRLLPWLLPGDLEVKPMIERSLTSMRTGSTGFKADGSLSGLTFSPLNNVVACRDAGGNVYILVDGKPGIFPSNRLHAGLNGGGRGIRTPGAYNPNYQEQYLVITPFIVRFQEAILVLTTGPNTERSREY